MALVFDHLWQSTWCAAAAAAVAWVLRRNGARARYVVWLCASIKFLVPFAALTAVGRLMPWPRAAAAVTSPPTAFLSVTDALSVPFSQSAASLPSTGRIAPTFSNHTLIVTALLVVWAAGAALILGRWILEWLRLRKRAGAYLAAESARERETVERLARQTSDEDVSVVLVDARLEPAVFGILRPSLFWPIGISDELTDEQIDAIVAHELCHVRWHDNAAAVAHMLAEALFWFHPVVWWIGARLFAERERACDESVLRAGREPRAYAEGILKICERQLTSPLPCIAGVTGSDLRRRIEGIMRAETGEALQAAKRLLLVCAIAAAVGLPVVAGSWRAERPGRPIAPLRGDVAAHVQAPASSASFDVASVKVNHSGDSRVFMQAQPGGRTIATNVTLRLLIRNAYQVQDIQIVDAPGWFATDRFDIEARAAGNPPQEQLQNMMRGLLEDQFHLNAHRETRELPVYDLVLARNDRTRGPQLRPSALDCSGAPGNSPSAPPPAPASALSSLAQCGFRVGPGTLAARGVTMLALAAALSNQAGRVVTDRTALDGSFDLDLTWTPGLADAAADQSGGSLFTSLQEQLGLKLQAAKGPVDVLVIDGATHPVGDTSPSSPSRGQLQAADGKRIALAPSNAAADVSFEVASIKPASATARSGWRNAPGRITGVFDVKTLISLAFATSPTRPFPLRQIVDGPDWLDTERFAIDAEASQDGQTNTAIPFAFGRPVAPLLRSLLADRFKLATHVDERALPVYALVFARSDKRLGPKLQPSKMTEADCEARRRHPSPDARPCGSFVRPGDPLIGMPISRAIGLLGPVDRIVLDRTGLKGLFDMEFQRDETVSIFTDVEEQLGLRLEPRTESLDVVVVDHVERPTPD